MCSEVAVDLYTTKILEAEVTVVDDGVCWASPMRHMAARYPRHVRTGDVVKCRDGTWVCVCEVTSKCIDCVFLGLRVEERTLLGNRLQVRVNQQMRLLEVLAHHAKSLNEKVSNIEYQRNVKACSLVCRGSICSVEKKRWRSGPKALLCSRR